MRKPLPKKNVRNVQRSTQLTEMGSGSLFSSPQLGSLRCHRVLGVTQGSPSTVCVQHGSLALCMSCSLTPSKRDGHNYLMSRFTGQEIELLS